MILYDNKMYFSANDGINGEELWTTDGSPAGTQLVKDINPGPGDSYPYDFYIHNNKLFFVSYEPNGGEELWVTNGTNAGTMLAIDARPGSASGYPFQVQKAGNRVVFYAAGANSPGIAFTDTTGSAIQAFTELNNGGDFSSYPGKFFSFTDKQVLLGLDDGPYGNEPYLLNLETGVATLLKDINPGEKSSSPVFLGKLGNSIFFGAMDEMHGSELWVTDGTSAGTQLFKEIVPGAEGAGIANLFVENGLIYNGELYFRAVHDTYAAALWKTNGTPEGTQLVKGFLPGSVNSSFGLSGFVEYNGKLYFSSQDTGTGFELFVSDGTPSGTQMLIDLNPGSTSSRPSYLMQHDGYLFFVAEASASTGLELYRSDGTPSGTVMVKDIAPGAFDSYANSLTSYNGDLYFSARSGNGVSPFELHKLIAPYEAANDSIIKLFDPASAEYINDIQVVNGTLYMSGPAPGLGIELWKSDGTTDGTVLLKDINPGASNSYPSDFEQINNFVYFRADDGIHGNELWKTDGTVAGTVLVKDIEPGSGHSGISFFGIFYGAMYFDAYNSSVGIELWRIVFDECPEDPAKTVSGACGCGSPDIDSDSDGTLDCADTCPFDVSKVSAGACGCGITDTPDSDLDGAFDCNDSCSADPAKTQPGICGCGVADSDTDGDGSFDCQDQCIQDPNKTSPGVCGCGIIETDSNSNGNPDCNTNEELKLLSSDFEAKIKKVKAKKAKNKAQKLLIKAIKDEAQLAYTNFINFINSTSFTSVDTGNKTYKKNYSSLKKFGKLAYKKPTAKNRKSAIKASKAVLKFLVN